MTVEEGKMGWGSFEITLKEDTPREVTTAIWGSPYSLIRLYEQRTTSDQVASSPGLFTGVLHAYQGRVLSGPGQTWYLGQASDMWGGDWDELGPYSLLPISFDADPNDDGNTADGDGTLEDWVETLLDQCGTGLTPGLLGGPSTKASGVLTRRTAKTILDNFVVPVFGVEYRVNPDLTVDVGYVSELYPARAKQPLAVRTGGRDVQLHGLQTETLDPEMSVEEFLTRGTAYLENGPYDHSEYNDHDFNLPNGEGLNWGHHQKVTTEQEGGARRQHDVNLSALRIARESTITSAVKVTAREFAITARVTAGEYIYVYDVDQGLFDLTNPMSFRARDIFPAKLRVEAVTWPVEKGMSVWFDDRHQSGKLIDISRYVEFEENATSEVTVGRPPRSLSKAIRFRK